jgi:putative ABC transport system substrate-binding protein
MAGGIGRRGFVSAIGGGLVWPLTVRAQRGDPIRRVGLLPTGYRQTDPEGQARVSAFIDMLGTLGWSDGRNVRLETRWPRNEMEEIKAETAALVASAPDVVVISANAALAVFKKLNQPLPTVFVQVSDPVGSGFVGSLAHPGGNTTGFQNFEPATGGKWLGLLKEAAPAITRAAVLVYADTAAHVEFQHAAEAVAPSLGVELSAVRVGDSEEAEHGVAAFAATPNGGLIVLPHPRNVDLRTTLIELTARLRLPAIYPFRYFAASGGLMSYGFDQVEQWRGAAGYVDRILRGAKPADLPVQAPTKYDLVINLEAAKALGLTVSPSLLAAAVEVIE